MAINDDFRTPAQRAADNKNREEKREKYLKETISIKCLITGDGGDIPSTIIITREETQKLVSFSGLLDDLNDLKNNYDMLNERF